MNKSLHRVCIALAAFALAAMFAGCRQSHYSENIRRGLDLFDAGKTAEAKAEFDEAVRKKPDSALARYLLGTSFADLGDFAAAKREIGEAVRLRPEWTWARIWLGMIALLDDDERVAEAQLEAVLASSPDRADAEYLLGLSEQINFRYDKAIPLMEKRLARDPGNLLFSTELGLLYNYEGKFDDAIRVLKNGAEHNPDNQVVFVYLGRAYANNGEFRQAEKTYLAAPKRETNPRISLELSDLYLATGEREKFLALYPEMAKNFPTRIDFREKAGNMYIEMGDLKKARAIFENIESFCPDCTNWSYGLARVSELEGDRAGAIKMYKKTLELSPGHAQAAEALKRMGER